MVTTKSCDVVIADLSAYLDGELDADQGRDLNAHLANCPRCAAIFDAMQQTDDILEREWRESAPLPSSLRFEQSVDSIMAALPPVSVETAAFATKRVHSRVRWMRFATGMAGALLLALSLFSSYELGYVNGRRSAAASSASSASWQSSGNSLRESLSHEFTASLLPASIHLAPACCAAPLPQPQASVPTGAPQRRRSALQP